MPQLAGIMSQTVRASLGSLFGSLDYADCVLQFCVQGKDIDGRVAEPRSIGDPLPAHRLVLGGGSRRLRLLTEGWNQQDPESLDAIERSAKRRRVERQACLAEGSGARPGSSGDEHGRAALPWRPDPLSLPELRVTLDREEELEAALAAIRFLYTGSLVVQQQQQGQGHEQAQGQHRHGQRLPSEQGMGGQEQAQQHGGPGNAGQSSRLSVGELVVLAKVAESLEVVDCAGACYAALVESFKHTANSSSSSSSSSSSMSSPASPLAPVLDLYSFRHLLPSPDHHPLVGPVLTACRAHLVTYWDAQLPSTGRGDTAAPTKAEVLAWLLGGGDAVRIANDSDLLGFWNALPAAALEELLQSDHLSTDDEATVVVLVEEWVAAQGSAVTEPDKARVRWQLRLVNCNTSYMFDVLPKLPWLDSGEAVFLARCRMIDRSGWDALGSQLGGYDTHNPWYGQPRPQPGRQEGVSCRWEVSREALLAGLRAEEGKNHVAPAFSHGSSNGCIFLTAFGYQWVMLVACTVTEAHTSVSIACDLPNAVGKQVGDVRGACSVSARLEVPDGANGTRELQLIDKSIQCGPAALGVYKTMPIDVAEPAARQQGQETAAGEVAPGETDAALLAPWAKLLGPEGKVKGTLTLRKLDL